MGQHTKRSTVEQKMQPVLICMLDAPFSFLRKGFRKLMCVNPFIWMAEMWYL
jgi:hypothetical protein